MTGAELLRTRKDMGWTQEQMAYYLRVGWRHVARMEGAHDKEVTGPISKLIELIGPLSIISALAEEVKHRPRNLRPFRRGE